MKRQELIAMLEGYRPMNGEAECLRGLEIDAQLDFGCLLDRKLAGLFAFEDATGSHKLGQLHHAERNDARHNLLSRGQTITVAFDMVEHGLNLRRQRQSVQQFVPSAT